MDRRGQGQDRDRVAHHHTSTADICRKYGLSPNTFYPWREKFLEGGRAALTGGLNARATKVLQRENATLKTLVGEITLANDALKKNVGGKEKMMAAQSLIHQEMSLNKALRWCGVTRKRWYYKPKARESAVNRNVLQLIRQIREERPFYGTRRMAAELSRMLDRPVNRKMVRRVYRRMGRGLPAQDLRCAKARWTPIKAARPNQVWETDHTLRLVRPARRLVLLLQRSGHLHQAVDRLPVRHPGHRERRRRVASRGRHRSQAGLHQADPPVRQRIPVRQQKVPKGRLQPGHQSQVHPDPYPRAERSH